MYREATADDAATVVSFQIAMAAETEDVQLDHETVARAVSAVFDNPALGTYFVAVKDSETVGVLMITTEWSDWRNGIMWWIQSVYVTPAARRLGIYGGLYSHVKQLAGSRDDVRGIRLYVDRRNTVAQEVYRRLGMNAEHYMVFEWMK